MDVDLLNLDAYHDAHVIAGLLKLYLRELPVAIIPMTALQLEAEMEGMERVQQLSRLVHELPIENFELLRFMIRHLKRIVDRAHRNRMTIENGKFSFRSIAHFIVAMVFCPTLSIPGLVLHLLVYEYELIFGEDPTTPLTSIRRPDSVTIRAREYPAWFAQK